MLDSFHGRLNVPKRFLNIEVFVIVPKRLCLVFRCYFHLNPVPQDSGKYCRSVYLK